MMMVMTMSMMIIRFSDNLMFPPQFNQTAPFMSIGIPGTVPSTIVAGGGLILSS